MSISKVVIPQGEFDFIYYCDSVVKSWVEYCSAHGFRTAIIKSDSNLMSPMPYQVQTNHMMKPQVVMFQ